MLPEHKQDLSQFTLVSIVKFVLTEGEKLIIFAFNDFNMEVQAEFGLVANLVSFVCRFIFQPIEEIAYNLFTKLKYQVDDHGDKKSEVSLESTPDDPLRVLATLTFLMSFIGISGMFCGMFLSRPFLKIVYTDKWATDSAVEIMQAYSIYCLFMALNGIFEAFAYAKAEGHTLKKLQGSMVVISIVYILASVFLSREIGIVGLIYGNCLNMGLRAFCSLYFIFKQEAQQRKVHLSLIVKLYIGYFITTNIGGLKQYIRR